MIVSKKVSMEIAHHLEGYKGPCKNMHGHHLVAEVGVEGKINSQGFILDFSLLKEWLTHNVVNVFDHSLINDIIPNPTAENIATWIADRIQSESCGLGLKGLGLKLAFIKVWETENSCVEWRPE